MASLYSNENFPLQTVLLLREMGHDVLTTHDAGNSGRSIPDDEVLRFAVSQGRCVVTLNRLHFMRLHTSGVNHSGIIVCKTDYDYARQAARINAAVLMHANLSGLLLKVYRGDQ